MDDRRVTVDGIPNFHITGTHLLIPWYKGRRRHPNAVPKQVFRHYQHEAPRRDRRQWGTRSAPTLSVSTKGVHGLWIIMWMSDQNHTLPQHLTHCPIGRQHNPCNFSKMPFSTRIHMEQRRRLHMIGTIIYGRMYRNVQGKRTIFTQDSREKMDERNVEEIESEVRGLWSFESRCRARPDCRALEKLAGYHESPIVRRARYCPTAPPSESRHVSSSRRFPVAVPRSPFFCRPRP